MTTLGFIGSGKIGGTLARLAVTRGYDVVVSNSRAPETLAELVAELGTLSSQAGEAGGSARADWAAEAAAAADVAIVSIPLKNIWQLDPAPFTGKIVLETTNYYPVRDGRIAAIDDETATTTGLLQEHLAGARVVKAFNHINWRHIPTQGLPAGDPSRRALAIASDHADAREWATGFYDQLGYDTVDVGSVAESWRIERDAPGYGPRLTVAELTAALASTDRAVVHA